MTCPVCGAPTTCKVNVADVDHHTCSFGCAALVAAQLGDMRVAQLCLGMERQTVALRARRAVARLHGAIGT